MIFYIDVSKKDVQQVKRHVFALPVKEQKQYYSLLNKLSNNFYGNCKSLNADEFAKYNKIVGKKKKSFK